jgi:hypothetical protein
LQVKNLKIPVGLAATWKSKKIDGVKKQILQNKL